MTITYAGVPLNLPDPDMLLSAFVDEYIPLEQSSIIGPVPNSIGVRNDPMGFNKVLAIQGPSYPPKPRLRFNELYWPTGAGRWAEGYFLCDSYAMGQIKAKVRTVAESLSMTGMSTLTAKLFLLPPRPLSAVPEKNGIWVLPLVDERYFWQFGYQAEGTISDHYSTTWAQLLDALFDSVDVSGTNSSIDTRYAIPEPAAFNRECPLSTLIDAACHSVGQRLVRQIDGKVKSVSWYDSASLLQENLKRPYTLIAGGDNSKEVPASLRPSTLDLYCPVINGCGWYRKSSDLKEPTGSRRKIIATFAAAVGTTPSNTDDINDLAAVILADYEEQLKNRYDYTFAGVQPWTFCGWDDHALFQFSQLPDGRYRCQTRIVSAPYNFGVEEMYHAFSDNPGYPGHDHLIGKLDGTLSQGGSATVSVWAGQPGSEADTGKNVKAYDWLMKSGATAIASGKKVTLTRICGVWYATNGECP